MALATCKQELGWTDYRVNFNEINKWWEIIFCAYLMISLKDQAFESLNSSSLPNYEASQTNIDWASPPQCNHQTGRESFFCFVEFLTQNLLFKRF